MQFYAKHFLSGVSLYPLWQTRQLSNVESCWSQYLIGCLEMHVSWLSERTYTASHFSQNGPLCEIQFWIVLKHIPLNNIKPEAHWIQSRAGLITAQLSGNFLHIPFTFWYPVWQLVQPWYTLPLIQKLV